MRGRRERTRREMRGRRERTRRERERQEGDERGGFLARGRVERKDKEC